MGAAHGFGGAAHGPWGHMVHSGSPGQYGHRGCHGRALGSCWISAEQGGLLGACVQYPMLPPAAPPGDGYVQADAQGPRDYEEHLYVNTQGLDAADAGPEQLEDSPKKDLFDMRVYLAGLVMGGQGAGWPGGGPSAWQRTQLLSLHSRGAQWSSRVGLGCSALLRGQGRVSCGPAWGCCTSCVRRAVSCSLVPPH